MGGVVLGAADDVPQAVVLLRDGGLDVLVVLLVEETVLVLLLPELLDLVVQVEPLPLELPPLVLVRLESRAQLPPLLLRFQLQLLVLLLRDVRVLDVEQVRLFQVIEKLDQL